MATRGHGEAVPGPAALMDPRVSMSDPETPAVYTHGWFLRMDSNPPTKHCLPLDRAYVAKRMANGEPLFVRVDEDVPPQLDHKAIPGRRKTPGKPAKRKVFT